MKLPIWLDCDPGHDDMMAIMLASTSPALNLVGISTTHGNQSVDKTFVNAVRTTFLTGNRVPVYRGFAEPLTRQSKACPEIHGESGLGGFDWTDVDKQIMVEPKDICAFYTALKAAIDTHATQNSLFTIVSTASFTNIAQFIKAYPEYASKIKLVSMAGNFKTIGNILPWSEFNVLIDPEACQYLLDMKVHITFIPLDVTHTVLFTPDVESRIKSISNAKFSTLIINLLNFFKDTYKSVFKFDFPPLHDPVAVYYLLNPNAFVTENVHVSIETKGEFTFGACCADWFKQFGGAENCTVCLKVDVEAFWNEMIKSLEVCAVNGGWK
ncbi:Uridine_nucleosidase [Hexamita inflata]|uniref:Uridine nucleosidase n=1 Tax=Hexamita inflata TaxID=28002 RepID=A0AA86NNE1_9EUKA|nr:Uridine nucleosidase [Hexamita inflata]